MDRASQTDAAQCEADAPVPPSATLVVARGPEPVDPTYVALSMLSLGVAVVAAAAAVSRRAAGVATPLGAAILGPLFIIGAVGFVPLAVLAYVRRPRSATTIRMDDVGIEATYPRWGRMRTRRFPWRSVYLLREIPWTRQWIVEARGHMSLVFVAEDLVSGPEGMDAMEAVRAFRERVAKAGPGASLLGSKLLTCLRGGLLTIVLAALLAALHFVSHAESGGLGAGLIGGLVPRLVERGEIERLLTSSLFHSNDGHLYGNLAFLVPAGIVLECLVGRFRWLIIVLSSVLGGSLFFQVQGWDAVALGSSDIVTGVGCAVMFVLVRYFFSDMPLVARLVAPIGSVVLPLILIVDVAKPLGYNPGHVGGAIGGLIGALVVVRGSSFFEMRLSLPRHAKALALSAAVCLVLALYGLGSAPSIIAMSAEEQVRYVRDAWGPSRASTLAAAIGIVNGELEDPQLVAETLEALRREERIGWLDDRCIEAQLVMLSGHFDEAIDIEEAEHSRKPGDRDHLEHLAALEARRRAELGVREFGASASRIERLSLSPADGLFVRLGAPGDATTLIVASFEKGDEQIASIRMHFDAEFVGTIHLTPTRLPSQLREPGVAVKLDRIEAAPDAEPPDPFDFDVVPIT